MSCTLAITFFLFLGCSISPERRPSTSSDEPQRHYRYSNHFLCQESEDPENKMQVQFSALSGMNVGPKQNQQFRAPTEKILRPFTSDGCSASPDGIPATKNKEVWADCCISHDTKYWAGGAADEKMVADNELEQCIANHGYKEIGKIYKLFVKEFGGPKSSQTFRWGYGWNYKRPYGVLSTVEEGQIAMLYGANKTDVQQMLSKTTELTQMCDSYDVVFRGYSDEEKVIYEFLNKKLKQEERIDWLRAGYFNMVKKDFLVKFDRCEKIMTITLFKDSQKPIQVASDCELF